MIWIMYNKMMSKMNKKKNKKRYEDNKQKLMQQKILQMEEFLAKQSGKPKQESLVL